MLCVVSLACVACIFELALCRVFVAFVVCSVLACGVCVFELVLCVGV